MVNHLPKTIKKEAINADNTLIKLNDIPATEENNNNNNKPLIKNALLVDLLEDRNFRTLYTLILAICCGLIINHSLRSYLHHGRISIGQELIILAFGKIHIVALIWMVMFLYFLLLFWCYKLWIIIALKTMNTRFSSVWNITGVLLYLIHTIAAIYFSILSCFIFNLPCASSAIVSMECTRLSMKGYALIRNSTPKIISTKNIQITFSNYLYFLFAPTLVYQDSYARTKEIRWRFVLNSVAEFIFCLFALSVGYEQLITSLEDFGLRKYTLIDVIQSIFENSAIAGLIGFLGFFTVLHSTQNVFAELLKFEDRTGFYKDWWTKKDIKGYYRSWNLLVQHWLYEYIYKDAYNYIFCKNKYATRSAVIIISAIFHEVIVIGISGFFYPVLLILYLISIGIMMVECKYDFIGNIFLLYSLALGLSINFNLYIIEYYARKHCPLSERWYVPTTFTCLA